MKRALYSVSHAPLCFFWLRLLDTRYISNLLIKQSSSIVLCRSRTRLQIAFKVSDLVKRPATLFFLVAAAGYTVHLKSSNQTVEQHCPLSFANETANSV
jgi:hypothetical protein